MPPQLSRLDTNALVQAVQRDAAIYLAQNPSAEEEQKVLAASLLCSLSYGADVPVPQFAESLQTPRRQQGNINNLPSLVSHASLSFDSVSNDDTISEDDNISDNDPRNMPSSVEVQQTQQARQSMLYTLTEEALRSPINAETSAPQQTPQVREGMLHTLPVAASKSPTNTSSSAPQQAAQKSAIGKGKGKCNKRVRFSDEVTKSSTHQEVKTPAKSATRRAAASALKGGSRNLRSKPVPSLKARTTTGQEEANHAQESGAGTPKTMQRTTTLERGDVTIASLAPTILPPTRTPSSATKIPVQAQATRTSEKRKAASGSAAPPTTPRKSAKSSRTSTPRTLASEIPTPPKTRTNSRRKTTNVEPAPILPPGTSLPTPRAPALSSSPTPAAAAAAAAATLTADAPSVTPVQSPTTGTSPSGQKIFLRYGPNRILVNGAN